MQEACRRLVEIDQAEADIKAANITFLVGQQNNQPDDAEKDVKDIVRRFSAVKAGRRNHESQDAGQQQEGREDEQNFVIQTFRSFHNSSLNLAICSDNSLLCAIPQ